MIRIAVIDDEKVVTDHIAKIADDFCISKQVPYEIKCYQLPNELLWDLQENIYYDIYFLDIEMDINGLKVAKEIRQLYLEPYIVFVTSYIQYSIRGYEYNAYRYIIKDEIEEKLPQVLELMHGQLENKVSRQYIIESASRIEKIDYINLYYIYVKGKYTYLHTCNRTTRTRKTLRNVFEELNANEFIYANKSYVVNLQHIMQLVDKSVIMRDGQEIPLSIPQFKNVKKAISHYWRGKL